MDERGVASSVCGGHTVKWTKFLPSPTPRLDDHVSIWSIKARDARTFFRIVGVLWLVALVFIVYKTPHEPPVGSSAALRDHGEFGLDVLTEFASVGIVIAIISMVLTRVVTTTGELLMTLYETLANRFVIPVIEAHKAEGREEGRAEAMAEWRDWNERRLAAERSGREFGEPPPDVSPGQRR